MQSDADRADVFRGLANPLRRQLLLQLHCGERAGADLQLQFKIPFPALSRHLCVLRETGLVAHRVQGRQRFYRLRPSALRRVEQWTRQFDLSSGHGN